MSTNECTASLNIAELPVHAAATALLAATSRLLTRAKYTACLDEGFVATSEEPILFYRRPLNCRRRCRRIGTEPICRPPLGTRGGRVPLHESNHGRSARHGTCDQKEQWRGGWHCG